jgi:putative redox protein
MNEAIEEYKKKIDSGMNATLTWRRDLVFTATTPRGYELDFDAENQWGCMPLESLLLSLAGCMAIDVVSILRKMRCELEGFSMEIGAERDPTPPQRIRKVSLMLHLEGEGIDEGKVARAIRLSEEKYCSVMHSLREDIEVETRFRLTG